MRLEIYAPRGSPVHRLHPAVKLGLLLVALLAPFLTNDPLAQAIPLGAALAVAAGARVLPEVLAPWRLVLFIFAVSFVLWGATSREGWLVALGFALRFAALFFLGLAYLATTRIEETIRALEIFRVPYRLAFALGLTFRLVPLFLQSASSIVEAQRARGLDLSKGGVLERLKKHAAVIVPIFMTSLRNADLMAMALDARGFSAGVPRTRWRAYPFGPAEVGALALGALYVAAFVALRTAGAVRSTP